MSDVQQLARLAQECGLSIATAESLTSGLLAGRVGEGSAAGDWFAGGVVAYRTEVKEHVLGVTRGIDPCSPECAEQLAVGVRGLMDADIAVSTTGVGGPDPQDGHPPGTVFLGWATREDTGHVALSLSGEPDEVLTATVEAAVSLLRERIDEFAC